jgi:hypothetical protein
VLGMDGQAKPDIDEEGDDGTEDDGIAAADEEA